MSCRPFVFGMCALSFFTSFVSSTLGLSVHGSSVSVKSQPLIIYCNKVFKTVPEFKTLLQHLCDLLPLIEHETQWLWNHKQSTGATKSVKWYTVNINNGTV